MLPYSWQRLLQDCDAASIELRFNLSILLNMAPLVLTTSSLKLEGTVTFGLSNIITSSDLYTHERLNVYKAVKMIHAVDTNKFNWDP